MYEHFAHFVIFGGWHSIYILGQKPYFVVAIMLSSTTTAGYKSENARTLVVSVLIKIIWYAVACFCLSIMFGPIYSPNM